MTHCDHHHHDHGHHHLNLKGENARKLKWVFFLTFLFMGVEVAGGLISDSLALLADAGHMFGDSGSLALAFFAAWLAMKPAPKKLSFGYDRVEVIAAFFNGLLLCVIAILIFKEALLRFNSPELIQSQLMLTVAVGGLIVNIIALKVLHGGHEHNLNMKGAYLHVLSDLLGSVGAIIASLLIMTQGWLWADAVISMIIAILVFNSARGLIQEAFHILLEGAPPDIPVEEIKQTILNYNGVLDVHNLHVWSISHEKPLAAMHLVVKPEVFSKETLQKIQALLQEKYHLHHATIQLETEGI